MKKEIFFKWWGRIFVVLFAVLFFEWLLTHNPALNPLMPYTYLYVLYTFVVWYSWIIPLGYFVFRKTKQ